MTLLKYFPHLFVALGCERVPGSNWHIRINCVSNFLKKIFIFIKYLSFKFFDKNLAHQYNKHTVILSHIYHHLPLLKKLTISDV